MAVASVTNRLAHIPRMGERGVGFQIPSRESARHARVMRQAVRFPLVLRCPIDRCSLEYKTLMLKSTSRLRLARPAQRVGSCGSTPVAGQLCPPVDRPRVRAPVELYRGLPRSPGGHPAAAEARNTPSTLGVPRGAAGAIAPMEALPAR
jgi:hypothetical protein